MPKRRGSIRMSDDEVWKFIEERKSLQVATIGADGAPHLTTLWFAIVDGEIAFETFTKSQKIVNLRRDPRIAVLVEDGSSTTSCAASRSTGAPCSTATRAVVHPVRARGDAAQPSGDPAPSTSTPPRR